MSLTTQTTAQATINTVAIVELEGMWTALAVLNVWYALIRIYEQVFGWRAGLDSFAPEFQTYWMSILWTEIPLELLSGLGLAGYLWKTRTRDFSNLAPREELRRVVVELQWLVLYGIALYWGASFFTEQDATWHMTVIRDTDFTPSHIIEFYMSYPIYSVIAVGGFFYAKTRLPYFAKGYSLAYLVVSIGPFMIIPNVGLNEWGHTFWFMEELFVAPLHWGFVFFGWMALGVFGVVLQLLMNIQRLIGKDGVVLLIDEPKIWAQSVAATKATDFPPPRSIMHEFAKWSHATIALKNDAPASMAPKDRSTFKDLIFLDAIQSKKVSPKHRDHARQRNLNAWRDEEFPKVGEAFRIFVNIGDSEERLVSSAPFSEPEWGDTDFLDLLILLSSRDCEIDPGWQELKLPRNGNSETVSFKVVATKKGEHRFYVRACLAKQLIDLQVLTFDLTIGEKEEISMEAVR